MREAGLTARPTKRGWKGLELTTIVYRHEGGMLPSPQRWLTRINYRLAEMVGLTQGWKRRNERRLGENTRVIKQAVVGTHRELTRLTEDKDARIRPKDTAKKRLVEHTGGGADGEVEQRAWEGAGQGGRPMP